MRLFFVPVRASLQGPALGMCLSEKQALGCPLFDPLFCPYLIQTVY